MYIELPQETTFMIYMVDCGRKLYGFQILTRNSRYSEKAKRFMVFFHFFKTVFPSNYIHDSYDP